MTNRVGLYIDGFNLYHGLCDLSEEGPNLKNYLKWFDVISYCKSYFDADGLVLSASYFFTATDHPNHSNQRNTRHARYIHALSKRGCKTKKGTLRPRRVKCKICQRKFVKHEEKKSDVSIAIQVLSDIIDDKIDHVAIVTGDLDQAPTFKAFRKFKPNGARYSFQPPGRESPTLSQLASTSNSIGIEGVQNFLFPRLVVSEERDPNPALRPRPYDP